MKECNCGRIPPCYGGKKFRIHEELEKSKAWDEIHDMVNELNKQMCDLDIPLRNPIKPLSEETAQELIGKWEKIGKEWASKKKEIVESIFGNVTNEKSNIMEEKKTKKTKKMTKAEAFEYLKGKKVYVNSHSAHIQATLFEAGYAWSSGSRNIDNEDMPFLLTTNHGEFFTICNMREFAKVDYEEISVDDILSIEIVEENRSEDELVEIVELGKKIQCLLSKLSGHKHVVITEDDVILYDEGMSLFHSDPF